MTEIAGSLHSIYLQRALSLPARRVHIARPLTAFSIHPSVEVRVLEFPPHDAMSQKCAADHANGNHGFQLAVKRYAMLWC